MQSNHWYKVMQAVDRAIEEIEHQLDRDVPQGQLRTDMEADVELLKSASMLCLTKTITRKTARFVKQIRSSHNSEQNVYEVYPPVEWVNEYESSKKTEPSRYITVSRVKNRYVDETFIFAANEDGEFKSWTELEGSTRPATIPDVLLEQLGYEVIREEQEF